MQWNSPEVRTPTISPNMEQFSYETPYFFSFRPYISQHLQTPEIIQNHVLFLSSLLCAYLGMQVIHKERSIQYFKILVRERDSSHLRKRKLNH